VAADDLTSDQGANDHTRSLTCFVIGPIGSRLAAHGSPERETYEESLKVMAEVIEPACERVGLTPVRADSLARAGEITEQIFRRLRDDDVVIADLTGANANVMYELGLRHTENKLTVQLGEYGRLPFDINTIRTIQFSPSAVGLINARDELVEVLSAGLAGEYDAVTATRVWSEARSQAKAGEASSDQDTPSVSDAGPDREEGPEEHDDYFLDVMVAAEEGQAELLTALETLNDDIVALGELAESSARRLGESDAAGRGMRGRLQVATRYAASADKIAAELEPHVDRYVEALRSVSAGNLQLIARMEEEPEQLEETSVREFGMVIRRFAGITRDSFSGLAELVESIAEGAKVARVLRDPSNKLTAAQLLGIPVPPEDWEPEQAQQAGPEHRPSGPQDQSSEKDLRARPAEDHASEQSKAPNG
jgi:hypothetical protein